jgi:sulfhydrogenase subunit gamma (sulfur reductase)
MSIINPYLPEIATIIEVIQETHNIKTFRVVLNDKEKMHSFTFEPGQVGQLSVFGVGEATFVINSPPTRKEYLQFSVMMTGEVTNKLHTLNAGDQIGVRAPLGNCFPYEDMKGKDIIYVGGGIGMAPLRTLLLFMLDNRQDYGDISLLYGARSPKDMAYSYELDDWLSRDDMKITLTIDAEVPEWKHKVGLIPNVLLDMKPTPENCVAVTCGPPIMIKFTLQALKKLGFEDNQIVTTLEKRMKCGVGICGRCNIGNSYVCKDGPAYTYEQLKQLPNEL